MSLNPLPENIEPTDNSDATPPTPQPPVETQIAPEIRLDEPTNNTTASIVKEPLFEPLLQGTNDQPAPDIYLDADTVPQPSPQHFGQRTQPEYETVEHHGLQPVDVEYPSPAPVPVPKTHPNTPTTTERIHSVDALRGFDMFWIVGGNILLLQLAKLFDWPWLQWATTQLQHSTWAGFTFYDLIFPLFLFLAGVSMPISLGKKIDNGASKASLLGKISIRALLLILLGIIYNGGLDLKPLAETRLFSVLGFIGISYFIAGLIFIYSDVKHRIIWALGLLGGYYAALMFINVPGHGPGVLTPEGVFTGYIDRQWIPWKLYTPNFDPEGLFLPISGAVVAIIGSLTGSFLTRSTWNKFLKAIMLGASGVAFYYASIYLEPHMIISKSFWSPTFVLHTLGWSLMLLGAFYLIMDAIGFWHWAFFFIVIGMNSITIYMALKLFNIQETSNKLFAGTIDHFYKIQYQPLITTIAFILTWWTILFIMYRKKVFLRV
ncbi:MAG: acyltransferase family protein [Akkermansiaceae bacterium]